MKIEQTEGCVRIIGSGALDVSNTEEFHKELTTAVSTSECVMVDLRQVTFVDTAILEYLTLAAKAMSDRGKRLQVIVGENSHPQYVLETVGFPQLMDIETVPLDS